ncbi:MAG: polysaccharide pyruvyl transferase family protein [Pseudomonadota bacterium]
MQVIYYRSPSGNFGDDLNAVLWRELLPPAAFEADDAVLLGIGSIFRDDFLSREATEGKRVFVLGSGAGTGPLPARWPEPEWSILAVRGPLTAALIGEPSAAVTDSAALLTVTNGSKPETLGGGDVVFFPHYNSVNSSRWPDICERLGFVFVDAHWSPHVILRVLGGARLVVTEAMHGAIVADTLRIPWIPVVCSPEIATFKWRDWTASLDLPYRPVEIPPSSGWEALKHRKIRLVNPEMQGAGPESTDAELIGDFHRRFGNGVADSRSSNGRKLASSALRKALAAFDPLFMDRAAAALERAAKSEAYLSGERVLAERVERLQGAVMDLRRALAV